MHRLTRHLPTFDFQFPQFRKDLGQLSMARRALRGVLLHIDLDPAETNVDTLLTLLDHFYQYPDEYREIIYDSI
jgi:hypothetical protein